MSKVLARRRYLTNFESHRVPHLFTDVIVIGAGVAGLRAALAAAAHGEVLVLCKTSSGESCSAYAQGGVAARMAAEDSTEAHAADTLEVGCGLCEEAVVRYLVERAPDAIADLAAIGARFDRDGAGLALGREGGHGAARIVHADGDATGREIIRALLAHARENPRIRFFEDCYAIDVVTHEGRAVGVVTFHAKYGHQVFWAAGTVLASGGAARMYRESTNPAVATGDGAALAFRAGAALRGMELIQFHPTTLYVAGAARALISEAVRGEGGLLVTRAGRRFMPEYHPQAELAPRDVVSRAIVDVMRTERAPHVFLDVRHIAAGRFAERFPTIHELCRNFDLDPAVDLIPVRPSAHYTIGGVVVDLDGRSAVDGLFAAGEVASCGLHGANRLASNSLMEGLVLGQRVGDVAGRHAAANAPLRRPLPVSHLLPRSTRTELDVADVRHSLQSLMWRNAAVERTGDRLRETVEIIEFWSRYVMDKVFDDTKSWETQNMLTAALCTTLAAATRCESRGVHYRQDYPHTDPEWRRHIDVRRADDDIQVATAPLRR